MGAKLQFPLAPRGDGEYKQGIYKVLNKLKANLVPRVFRLFGQRGKPGRLWGHQILLPQDFCGKTIETVTEQPIKKIEFFRCPQSLPGVAPLTKTPEDSGYEIGLKRKFPLASYLYYSLVLSDSWVRFLKLLDPLLHYVFFIELTFPKGRPSAQDRRPTPFLKDVRANCLCASLLRR